MSPSTVSTSRLISALMLLAPLLLLAQPTNCHPAKPGKGPAELQDASPLAFPNTTLPSPSGWNWNLTALALGLGTQNYSCASASALPVAVGAHATLFNALPLLSSPRGASLVPTLPASALQLAPAPAFSASTFPAPATAASLGPGAAIIGRHFFTAAGTPTFDLYAAAPSPLYLSSKKVANMPAPGGSYAGKTDMAYGAVDWLFLEANAALYSEGLSAVYRLETAGGKPPPDCSTAVDGLVTVDYSAEYWFYN